MSEANLKQTRTILSPIVTYKSTQNAQQKCYTFYVRREANKFEIADEFKRLYNGKVLRVNTVTVRSKNKRNKKGYSRKADWKKAYIYTDIELDIFPKIDA
ncbi:MAG: 50S ribosomal protein L23 [Candidatus Caenarcaniphilales bacterium]|nr:50S ribosomal protein L23 [Candidatus Caenarcaniphilales bacterium]